MRPVTAGEIGSVERHAVVDRRLFDLGYVRLTGGGDFQPETTTPDSKPSTRTVRTLRSVRHMADSHLAKVCITLAFTTP